MPVTKLKENSQSSLIIALLNQQLANTIDFKLSTKEAHWNVKGDNFIALHELFDKASAQVDEYADMVAERIRQLDGTAEGSLATVAEKTALPPYPTEIHSSEDHVKALSTGIGLLAETHRKAIKTSADAGDAVTADMFTEITRKLDKLHWFIRSNLKGA